MLTTILFDLDGTLMNTLDDLHESVSYALREAGGLPPNTKEDTRRFLGNGVRRLVWQSVERACPDADEALKERVLDAFRAHYVVHSMDRTAPYEGIPALLRECKRRGLFTAIVSNKLAPAVKDLHKAFFADCIDVAIGETPTVKRKPAPDMVNEAIRQLSLLHGREIRKSECVYVGDSEVDLLTAQNAGLACIAVSWGFRDKGWLEQCGAQVIADSPNALSERLFSEAV
ncbi:MAG: HAD family hydrolase [Bacteroidaceae bacterium]|nr:HAD family hydrolase [Bacteroidaceae bacterium]